MEGLKTFFDALGGYVWGAPMLILLVGTGIWLTIRLIGLQFTMLPYALKLAFFPHPNQRERGGSPEPCHADCPERAGAL